MKELFPDLGPPIPYVHIGYINYKDQATNFAREMRAEAKRNAREFPDLYGLWVFQEWP